MPLKNVVAHDVNLDGMHISADGKTVSLRFIDMLQGSEVLTIHCNAVIAFSYQNAFFEDEGLAAYVGTVTIEIIERQFVNGLLNEIGYGFQPVGGRDWQFGERCFWTQIDGAEVSVRLLSGGLVADPPLTLS